MGGIGTGDEDRVGWMFIGFACAFICQLVILVTTIWLYHTFYTFWIDADTTLNCFLFLSVVGAICTVWPLSYNKNDENLNDYLG